MEKCLTYSHDYIIIEPSKANSKGDRKMKYCVTTGNKKQSDDEFVTLTTENKQEAIKRAKDERYYIERDKINGGWVEIRVYREDIEDEDCECFDYDLVEF